MLVVLASPVFAEEGAEPVWGAMQAPGRVIVLRHSYAPGGFDPPGARLDDCSIQRNLDERGRTQARAIGEVFRRRGVTVGAVPSSPRCRCMDTGRLAFGSSRSWPPLQGARVVTDLTGVNVQMGELVVLRREPDGRHAVAGRLYIE
jgi:broad specificity phosphatase PhoE